eukprot:c20714_g1_i2 orf=623-1120(-)
MLRPPTRRPSTRGAALSERWRLGSVLASELLGPGLLEVSVCHVTPTHQEGLHIRCRLGAICGVCVLILKVTESSLPSFLHVTDLENHLSSILPSFSHKFGSRISSAQSALCHRHHGAATDQCSALLLRHIPRQPRQPASCPSWLSPASPSQPGSSLPTSSRLSRG